ncbi:iron dependent repressor, metal binding and dimerization domain protein [Georgenia sp. Z1491]|uniref:metal-dependent transcriptional regulator n=1 Tax=Georgenia sp. Z1491 TaxID=3416707 RepID=UPI003CFADAE6
MSDLIDTTEMYLKAVVEMEEEGVPPLRARIAERLGHSGPTVSQTVGRMERDGLLHLSPSREVELTEVGRDAAVQVMRRHRLAERLLVDVVGLDWAFVHEEACRWEHVMSGRVEERLVDLLGDPTTDPYGNPIPGSDAPEPRHGMTSLAEATAELAEGQSSELEIVRIGEPLQVHTGLLADMRRGGLLPGARITVTRRDDVLELDAGQELVLEMSPADGRHLAVVA